MGAAPGKFFCLVSPRVRLDWATVVLLAKARGLLQTRRRGGKFCYPRARAGAACIHGRKGRKMMTRVFICYVATDTDNRHHRVRASVRESIGAITLPICATMYDFVRRSPMCMPGAFATTVTATKATAHASAGSAWRRRRQRRTRRRTSFSASTRKKMTMPKHSARTHARPSMGTGPLVEKRSRMNGT